MIELVHTQLEQRPHLRGPAAAATADIQHLERDKGVRKKQPVVKVVCLSFFWVWSTFAVVDAGFLVTFWAGLPLSCWTFLSVDDDDGARCGKRHSRYNIRTNPQPQIVG